MRVLAFIRQRSFARYVAIDLAEAARGLGWSVHWLDLEGRIFSSAGGTPESRDAVASAALAEIERFDPQLVFSYGLEYLEPVFQGFALEPDRRFSALVRRPAACFCFDFGFPFDRPVDELTRPYIDALQSPGAFAFCWDREAVACMRAYGVNKTRHFPMAVNRAMFRPDPAVAAAEPAIPVLFVGGPDADRNRVLAPLADAGLEVYGYHREGWTPALRACHRGELLERPALCRVYNRARISVNVTRAHGPSSLNMRVFEAMACGTLLLTDDKADVHALFRAGEDLVVYRDEQDLVEQVRYYLAHDEARTRIADAGMAKVHARHSYDERLRTISSILEQVYLEHEIFAKLDAYAATDPGKALAFVDYVRSHARVEHNTDNLACRAGGIRLARGDLDGARREIRAALDINPGHLAARERLAALR